MYYRALSDAVLVVHFAFVLFVVLGGLLVFRRPRLAWLHVPAALWASLIEFAGWICPLTPLEQYLNQPEVMVPFAQDKVDGNGRVTDEKTRKKVRELLENLVAWTRRIKLGEGVAGTAKLAA